MDTEFVIRSISRRFISETFGYTEDEVLLLSDEKMSEIAETLGNFQRFDFYDALSNIVSRLLNK